VNPNFGRQGADKYTNDLSKQNSKSIAKLRDFIKRHCSSTAPNGTGGTAGVKLAAVMGDLSLGCNLRLKRLSVLILGDYPGAFSRALIRVLTRDRLIVDCSGDRGLQPE
jgi:hypothetical protein